MLWFYHPPPTVRLTSYRIFTMTSPRSGRHMSGIGYLYILYIYMYISWHRLSSYGTQAPHKWSMVMTCYNSVYRGCHPTVARLFIRPFIGAPFYPLQELTLQELIPAKQATSHKKCPSWFPKSPLGKSPNTGLGWDSLQKKVKLYNNNPYGD